MIIVTNVSDSPLMRINYIYVYIRMNVPYIYKKQLGDKPAFIPFGIQVFKLNIYQGSLRIAEALVVFLKCEVCILFLFGVYCEINNQQLLVITRNKWFHLDSNNVSGIGIRYYKFYFLLFYSSALPRLMRLHIESVNFVDGEFL